MDLSEIQLSELLGITFEEALAWLEKARFISDMVSLGSPGNPLGFEMESHELLMSSSVQDLMYVTIGEIRALKSRGELYSRFPYLKRQPLADNDRRFYLLREILRDEKDFEARYPKAHELLFGYTPHQKYELPSFEVSIAKSAPRSCFHLAGFGSIWEPGDSIDSAFSSSGSDFTEVDPALDSNYQKLDYGFLRGLLIAIISREEFFERIAIYNHVEGRRERIGAPAKAEIRLTDLRLACHRALSTAASKKATRKLLEDELTTMVKLNSGAHVKAWKREILERRLRGQDVADEDSETDARERENLTVRITFAAAAILLYYDLRTLPENEIDAVRLTSQILSLAKLIRDLSNHLDQSSKAMEKNLADRSDNRPSKLGLESYNALVAYRMGKPLDEISRDLGTKPYRSSPAPDGSEDSGGTKQWKKRTYERLLEGATVEDKFRPSARSVFNDANKPETRSKALEAYEALLDYQAGLIPTFSSSEPEPEFMAWYAVGATIDAKKVDSEHDLHVIEAYVQLGWCIKHDRTPYPDWPEIKNQKKSK